MDMLVNSRAFPNQCLGLRCPAVGLQWPAVGPLLPAVACKPCEACPVTRYLASFGDEWTRSRARLGTEVQCHCLCSPDLAL
eukprot:15465709-Alexandrium_andersonii.AAC.1